jgi:CBS domain-containing protein
MQIRQVMKTRVVSIPVEASLGEAVRLMVGQRIGLLPVVDRERKLVGVLRLRDVLALCLPSFVGLMEDTDFVRDFGAGELGQIDPALSANPVTDHMQPARALPADSGLLRAHAFMRQHDLPDVPVIDADGRLVGIASWVDVGVGFLGQATGPA